MKRVVSIKLGIKLEDAIKQIIAANHEKYPNVRELCGKLEIAPGTYYKYIGNPKFQPRG